MVGVLSFSISFIVSALTGCSNPSTTVTDTEEIKQETAKKAKDNESSENDSDDETTKMEENYSSNDTEKLKKEEASIANAKSQYNSEKHTHNWVAQTKTVHHDAQYGTRYVVDQADYDEQVPQYKMVEHEICNGCQADLSGLTESQMSAHFKQSRLSGGNCGGWHSAFSSEIVGYTTIHHDEEGHNEQYLIKDAYDEIVSNGYKCSKCGATKS